MSQNKAQLIELLQKLLTADDGHNAWEDDIVIIKDDVATVKEQVTALALEGGRTWIKVEDIAARVAKVETERPVMHVQINERPVIKLSGRVHPLMPDILALISAEEKPALVGPPGAGKSYLAKQVSQALALPFYYVNLTQGASETWLFGRQTPTGFFEGPFATAYRTGGVFLADELDAADANLLLAINTALESDVMFNPMSGENVAKHKDFVFMAAMNTNGLGATTTLTGRVRLDESTLDRLTLIGIDYDTELERELCPDVPLLNYLTALRNALVEGEHSQRISTRKFKSAYRQLVAGRTFEAIVTALTFNWKPSVKSIAKELEHIYVDADEPGEVNGQAQPVKRGRGRPRKYPRPEDTKTGGQ